MGGEQRTYTEGADFAFKAVRKSNAVSSIEAFYSVATNLALIALTIIAVAVTIVKLTITDNAAGFTSTAISAKRDHVTVNATIAALSDASLVTIATVWLERVWLWSKHAENELYDELKKYGLPRQ